MGLKSRPSCPLAQGVARHCRYKGVSVGADHGPRGRTAKTGPVVVTDAMRNSGLPGTDGPGNLDAAVRVAASPLAQGIGVLIVVGDEIHLARAARKRHSSFPAAFENTGIGTPPPPTPRLKAAPAPGATGVAASPGCAFCAGWGRESGSRPHPVQERSAAEGL
ncbi:asparaginase domain-containing protein [Streptacidiphilus sp. MAP12-16]|uniref:asparaginase domain-containing protein n=1 Tax=Streptacidiphilus sp. MAP12-16 TaxID=3156300 RepID=UPI003519C837